MVCRSSAKSLLQHATINSEDSDPQTLRCLEVLAHVRQDADTLCALVATLASFNGRAFSPLFLKLVTEAKEVPSAAQVDGLIGKALKAVPNDEWLCVGKGQAAMLER